MLQHFIDEETVSFDIFEFDVEEEKFDELNKSLTSFLTTHLEEAQRPQKLHIAERNDNIRQLSEPSPNIEQSYFDNFHNEAKTALNSKNFDISLESDSFKRYNHSYQTLVIYKQVKIKFYYELIILILYLSIFYF